MLFSKNAKLSRLHNDANVITLGERLISKNLAFKCINAFLNTKFEGGRYLNELRKYKFMSSETKYLNSEYKDFFEKSLLDSDPEIYKAINDELVRQQNHIELIALKISYPKQFLKLKDRSNNKYAEGYPGKRYYNGCEHVDVAEQLAIDRLKELFNCKFPNAQPHSGAQANGAVFLALLKPGDTFMGMSLNSGGHITHGLKISMSANGLMQ